MQIFLDIGSLAKRWLYWEQCLHDDSERLDGSEMSFSWLEEAGRAVSIHSTAWGNKKQWEVLLKQDSWWTDASNTSVDVSFQRRWNLVSDNVSPAVGMCTMWNWDPSFLLEPQNNLIHAMPQNSMAHSSHFIIAWNLNFFIRLPFSIGKHGVMVDTTSHLRLIPHNKIITG